MAEKNLVKDLQDLINKIDTSVLPYQRGNCIRIGHMIVQERKHDYSVYDSKTKKQVAVLFCKTSAVALAKALSNGYNNIKKVQELDQIIEKNYTDCLFYKNTLSRTKDHERKEIIKIRYEIAKKKTQDAREKLDRFIF